MDRELCLKCLNFKACENMPAPMGWCNGTRFNPDGSEDIEPDWDYLKNKAAEDEANRFAIWRGDNDEV